MFSKGPRFQHQKASDVQEANLHDPLAGLGASDTDVRKVTGKLNVKNDRRMPSQTNVDRYALLQRKVDDLDKVHADGKKAHQAEIQRLTLELSRGQKSLLERTDRMDKQKKQIGRLETCLQELKKAATSDQIEIKDLRAKLRMSEQEKSQLASKQGDLAETKKSSQALETRRREELREKDRRIAELEKALYDEKLYKKSVEEVDQKRNQELQAARQAVQKLEIIVADSRAEACQVQSTLASLRQEDCRQKEILLAQLEDHRKLLDFVAQDYGRLARSSVSLATHARLQKENIAMAIQNAHLERKLANSVAQVDELAVLIRQTNEQIAFFSERLQDAHQEIVVHQSVVPDEPQLSDPDTSVVELAISVTDAAAAARNEIYLVDLRSMELWSSYYKTATEQVSVECAFVIGQFNCEQRLSKENATSIAGTLRSQEAITAQLGQVQAEKDTLQQELRTATEFADSLKSSSESLAHRAAEAEERLARIATDHEAALKKEHDVNRGVTVTMQKMRMAEDALRAEIEQLTAELTDTERYKDAYYSLSDEVGSLVARNQLAEVEAQKLSKFNAEILGHNNPAQRIMYVDRIRKELAEVKHKLVVLNQDREAAAAINEDLQHELDMYKSVMVSADNKPRTGFTRVARLPLVNLAHNLNARGSQAFPTSSLSGQDVYALESIPNDMTLDEIT
ncbi:hypothetical protein H0H93_008295 [Arthromyces matolae]|nr:hypothetical protein H0H93_008295 [Arthromyces matolae]